MHKKKIKNYILTGFTLILFYWIFMRNTRTGSNQMNARNNRVTVHKQEFSELKIPYDTVLAADFADLECAASAKSRCWAHMCEQ